MKNKTVKHREKKPGGFTTVNHKTLRAKNLTSNAKILLIEILSDSDGFKFSETLFIKRMGISKSAYYRALNNLIENGYVRITKIGNSHYNYYTVSEYGNLNKKKEDEDSIEETKVVENSFNDADTSELPIIKKKYHKPIDEEGNKKLLEFMNSNDSFLTNDIAIKYSEGIENNMDFYELKSVLTKMFEKVKKKHFKECKEIIETTTAYNEASKKEAIKLLKDEIFVKNKWVEIPMKLVHKAVANISRNKPLDQESLDADRLGGQPEND